MSDNIIVAVRLRPLITREESEKSKINWEVNENEHSIVQIDPISRKKLGSSYIYDKIFPSSSSTEDVHNSVTKPIVESALSGFNGTIFAYGQTSSGKTYTMMGNPESQGIIPLAVKDIFNTIENTPDREYLIRASYMEIYNENVTDLLSGKEGRNKVLSIREDGAGIVYVADLKEQCVIQEKQLLNLIQKGDKWRHVGSTNMNERSSRSHSIFRLIIESRERGEGLASEDSAITVSHLNLVDLAGSENVSQTGATGDRLKEGGFINKSLFMLGRVISQLSEGENFVNFRDSKLTRILQASLGGNAKTAIICTVTPAGIDQTHSTLRFASRAKSVKNKPIVNEVLSDTALLKRYMREISQLKEALENEKRTNKAQEVEMVKEKLDEQERRNKDLQDKIRQLSEKMVVSSHAVPVHQVKGKKKNRRETWAAPAIQRLMRKSSAGLEIERFQLEHDFLKPALPPMKRELPCIEEDLSTSNISQSDDNISKDSEGASGINIEFGTPNSVSKRRKKKKRVHFDSILSSPVKSVSNVECQTDESLLPKSKYVTHAQTPCHSPNVSNSVSQESSLGTPVHVLRSRNAALQSELEETTDCLDSLKEEMKEMCDFHANELDLREESFRIKIYEGADLSYIQELKKRIESLERSQRDTENLLIDANKSLALRSQELVLNREDCEHLKSTLDKQSNASVELEELKTKFDELSHTMQKKSEQLDQMEKERRDFDTMMELALQKKSVVEKDLRRSLQDAWGEIAVLEGSSQDDVQRRWEQLQTLEKELEILREKTTKQSSSSERVTQLEDQLADLAKKLEESERKIAECEMQKADDKLFERQASELEELEKDPEYSKAWGTDLTNSNQRIHFSVPEKCEESSLEDLEVDGRPSNNMSSAITRRRSVRLSHMEMSNKLSETLQVLEESILNSSALDPQSPDFVTLPIGLSDLEMLKNELLILQEALLTQEKERDMIQNIAYQSWVVADHEKVAAIWKMQENFCGNYLLHSNSQSLKTVEEVFHKKNVPSALDISSVAQVNVVKTKEFFEKCEDNLQRPQIHSDAPVRQDINVEDISYINTTCPNISPCSLADELREADMDFTLNINEVLGTCGIVRSDPLQELQSLRERHDIIMKENSDLFEEVQHLKGKLQDERIIRKDNEFSAQLKGCSGNEECAHKEKLQSENDNLAKSVLQLKQEVQEHRINEEELHCLRWKVDSLKTEKDELDTQLSLLKEERVFSAQLKGCSSTEECAHKEKLQSENDNLAKGVLHLEQEVQEHRINEEEMHCLRWKVDALRTEKEELDAQLSSLKEESVRKDLYEELEKELFKAEETIKRLEKGTENTTELYEKEEEMERLITNFMIKEEKYELEIENIDNERARLKRQFIDEESKVKKLEKLYAEQEDKFKISLDSLATKDRENEKLKLKFEEEKMKVESLMEKLAKNQDDIVKSRGLPESCTDMEDLMSEVAQGKNLTHSFENVNIDFQEKKEECSEAEDILVDLKVEFSKMNEEKGTPENSYCCLKRKWNAENGEENVHEEKSIEEEEELKRKDEQFAHTKKDLTKKELEQLALEQICDDLKRKLKEKDDVLSKLEDKILLLELKSKTPLAVPEDQKQAALQQNVCVKDEAPKDTEEQKADNENDKKAAELEKKNNDPMNHEKVFVNSGEGFLQIEKEQYLLEGKILSLEKELKITHSVLEDKKLESFRLDMLLKEESAKHCNQQIIHEEKLREVTEELEKKNADLADFQNALADLKYNFSQREREYAALEKVAQDLTEKLEGKGNLEVENFDLEKDLKANQSSLEDERHEVARVNMYIEGELSKKDCEQDLVKEKCKKLAQELDKKNAEQILLEQALADLREKVSTIEREQNDVEQICVGLRGEVKEKDDVQTNLESRIWDLEKKLKDTHSVLEDEKQESSRLDRLLEEELAEKCNQQIIYEEKLKEALEELEKKNADLVARENICADLNKDFSQKEREFSSLMKTIEDLNEKLNEKSNLEAENFNLENDLRATQSVLEDERLEVVRLNLYIKEELSKKCFEQDTLIGKCEKLSQEIEKKDDEKVLLEQALAHLKENVSKKEKEHNVVQQLCEDLKGELKEKDEVQANSETKMSYLEKELKASHSVLEDEKQEVSRLNLYIKEELFKNCCEQDTLKEKCEKLSQEIKKKDDEKVLLEQALADLKENFSKKEKEHNVIQQICEDLRGELKEKDEVQANTETKISNLEKELKASHSVLEDEKQESSRLVMLLKEDLAKKSDQHIVYEDKYKEVIEKLGKKNTELILLEKALADLKEDLTKKEKEKFDLEKVIEDLYRTLKEKDVEQSRVEAELWNLQNLKASQLELENVKQELCQMNKDKEVMVALHEEELQRHKDEGEDLNREIDVMKKEISSMKVEVDKLAKEKFVLEDANSELSEDLKEIIQKHNIEIDGLTQRELQLEREMKALQDCLEEKDKEYNQPDENELIRVRAEIEMVQEKLVQVEKELEEKKILLEEKNQECEKLTREIENLSACGEVEESKSNDQIGDLERQTSPVNRDMKKKLDGNGGDLWYSKKSSETSDVVRDVEVRISELEKEQDEIYIVLGEKNRECELGKEANNFMELRREENSSVQFEDLRMKHKLLKMGGNMTSENLSDGVCTYFQENSDSSKMNELLARISQLKNELIKKEELLEEKSKECQRLDEEMDDLVAHYKRVEVNNDTYIEDLRNQVVALESEMKKQNTEEKSFYNVDNHLKEVERHSSSGELHTKMLQLENELEKILEKSSGDCMRITDEIANLVQHFKKEISSENQTEEGRMKGSALELTDVNEIGCLNESHCATYREKSGISKGLQARVTKLENELEKRKQVLEEKSKECKLQTNEMVDLVEHYREKENRSDIQIQELRRQVSLLEKELHKNSGKKGVADAGHHHAVGVESSSICEEIQSRVTQLESKLEEKEKLLEEKNKECKHLDEEMDDLVAHYKEEEQKNDVQIEDLRKQVLALEEKLKKVVIESRVVDECHHSTGEEVRSYLHKELQVQTTSLENELKKREEILEEKTKECKHLMDLVGHCKERENISKIQIQELQKQMATLEEELKNAVTSDKGVGIKCVHHHVRDVETSNISKELQGRVSQLENELEKKEKTLEEKEKECKRLDEEMDDLVEHYKEEEKKSDVHIENLRRQVLLLEEELKKQSEPLVEGCSPVRETEAKVGQSKELRMRGPKNENELRKRERVLEEKERKDKSLYTEIDDHAQNTSKKDDSYTIFSGSFKNQDSTLERSDRSVHFGKDVEKSGMNTELARFSWLDDGLKKGESIEDELAKEERKLDKYNESKDPHQKILEFNPHDKQREIISIMQKEDPGKQALASEKDTERDLSEEKMCGDESCPSLEGSGMKFVGRLSLSDEAGVEPERAYGDGSCPSFKEIDMKCVEGLAFSDEAFGKSQEMGAWKCALQAPLEEENIASSGKMIQEINSGSDETFYKILRENNVLKMRLKALNAPALKELQSVKAELHHSNEKVKHLKTELRRFQRSQNMNTTICEMNAHRVTTAPTNEPVGTSSKKFDFSGGQSGIVLETKVIDLQNQLYHLERDMNKVKQEREVLKQHVEHFKGKAVEWKTNCLDARHQHDECKEKLVTYEKEKQTYQRKIDYENEEKVLLQFTVGQQREQIEKLEKEQLESKSHAEKKTELPSRVVNKNVLQEQERNSQGNVTEGDSRSRVANSVPQRTNIFGGVREKLPMKIQPEIHDGTQKENIRELGQKRRTVSGTISENRIPAKYLLAPRPSTGQREDECKTQ